MVNKNTYQQVVNRVTNNLSLWLSIYYNRSVNNLFYIHNFDLILQRIPPKRLNLIKI